MIQLLIVSHAKAGASCQIAPALAEAVDAGTPKHLVPARGGGPDGLLDADS